MGLNLRNLKAGSVQICFRCGKNTMGRLIGKKKPIIVLNIFSC
jgi:hypothetical protein